MSPRLSVIIASFNEPTTIEIAVRAFLAQLPKEDVEVIVVAPDADTLNVVRDMATHDHRVQWIQDEQRGKPAALNLAIQKAAGDILIFSDGDVRVSQQALRFLLQPFEQDDCGATTGHPIPMNPRNTKFGYFAHLLTSVADRLRQHKDEQGEPLDATGYLIAIRRELLSLLPEDTLADDPVMTSMVLNHNKRIRYVTEAIVHVQFPTHYRDWFKQKTRTFGGYLQPHVTKEKRRMRSFLRELQHVHWVLGYPKTPREVWWTGELLIARLVAWIGAFYKIRVQKKSLQDVWKPVASTK